MSMFHPWPRESKFHSLFLFLKVATDFQVLATGTGQISVHGPPNMQGSSIINRLI